MAPIAGRPRPAVPGRLNGAVVPDPPSPMPAPDDRTPARLGALAVDWARQALVGAVRDRAGRDPMRRRVQDGSAPPELAEVRGVFVTLSTHPGDRLRGCIGFPLPVLPLTRGISQAAAAAALDDPRFPPVRTAELGSIVIEVSLLTVPEPIEGPPADRVHRVRVGVDGLILEDGPESGLLLPQVAPEQGWDAREFLEGLCEKAGVAPGSWKRADVTLRRFQAEVFRESTPGGPGIPSSERRPPD